MEYGAVKARIPVGIGPERIVIRQGMVDRIAVGRREGIDQLLGGAQAAGPEKSGRVEELLQRAAFRVVGRPDDLGAVGIGPGECGGRVESVGSVLREFEIHHFGGVFRRVLPARKVVVGVERRRGPLQVNQRLQGFDGQLVETMPADRPFEVRVGREPVAVGLREVFERPVAVVENLLHALLVGGSFERAGVGVEDIDGFEHDGES